MEGEVLIRVDNVSKKFCKNLKKSLKYGFWDIGEALLGKKNERELREDEFWAVKDVSFEVKRGECLGLIGHNGAGKSTLLKMLNGLIYPDKGRIEMTGRVGALIELGAGFSPILTGRENIYNSAAVYGFTKEETDKKFEEIVEFSGLKEFLEMPVQSYSSGMRVRLGFAVAAHMEPDILLIDEVLAVGDLGFRIKCLNKISEILNECAVIFVSHSMPQIARICNSGIMLTAGKVHLKTDLIGKLIEEYYHHFDSNYTSNEISPYGIKIMELKINGSDFIENTPVVIDNENDIKIEFEFDCPKEIKLFSVHLPITDTQMIHVAVTTSLTNIGATDNNQKRFCVAAQIPNAFSNGKYYVGISIIEVSENRGHFNIGKTIYKKENSFQFLIRNVKLFTSVPILLNSQFTIANE